MVRLGVLLVPSLFSIAYAVLTGNSADVAVTVGGHLQLFCQEKVYQNWTKNGHQIENTPARHVGPGKVIFSKLEEDDSGLYVCPDGETSFNVTIIDREKLEATEGTKFCHSFDFPSSIDAVLWYTKHHVDLRLSKNKTSESEDGCNAKLEAWTPRVNTIFCIDAVKMNDTGRYDCPAVLEYEGGASAYIAERSFDLSVNPE